MPFMRSGLLPEFLRRKVRKPMPKMPKWCNFIGRQCHLWVWRRLHWECLLLTVHGRNFQGCDGYRGLPRMCIRNLLRRAARRFFLFSLPLGPGLKLSSSCLSALPSGHILER